MSDLTNIRLVVDPEAHAAYLEITYGQSVLGLATRKVARTVQPSPDVEVMLDIDDHDRVVGVEILDVLVVESLTVLKKETHDQSDG